MPSKPRRRRRRRPSQRRPQGRPRIFTDEQMIAALVASKGMPFIAAASIGCIADTIYDRAKVSPEVAQVMKHHAGVFLDICELTLFEAAMAKEAWAVMFALSHKGKDRGYTTRQEIETREAKQLELIEEIVESPDGEDSTQNPPA